MGVGLPSGLAVLGGRRLLVYGFDSVESLLDSEHFLFKLIANEFAVHCFVHTTEHRDASVDGLGYKEDSAGNALAAMVKPGSVEFRFHRKFSDARVAQICRTLREHPELSFLAAFQFTYQGRLLLAADESASW